jgi:hypothetical protein
MASISESERILGAAIAGIPQVEKKIVVIPTALRERALEAVERSYQQTVRDLGHSETDAQGWIAAMMFRLRSQVAEHEKLGGNGSEVFANLVDIRKRG